MSFLIVVLSPSKRLDFEAPSVRKHTQPAFLDDARKLVGRMKKLSAPDLQRMMGISRKVADLNVARYREWKKPFTPDNAKQALLAFRGDVYLGLAAESFIHTPLKVAPGKALHTPLHSLRDDSAHLHRMSSPSASTTRIKAVTYIKSFIIHFSICVKC